MFHNYIIPSNVLSFVIKLLAFQVSSSDINGLPNTIKLSAGHCGTNMRLYTYSSSDHRACP